MAFSFGSARAAVGVPPAGSTSGSDDLAIPDLSNIFPHLQLAEAIENDEILPTNQSSQILAALVDTPASAAPNELLRSRLLHMNLIIQNSRQARLQNYMLPDIIFISNSLQISEATAIGLYHHATANSAANNLCHSSSPTTLKDTAIRLYWKCRMRQVQLAKHALIRGLQDAEISSRLLNNDNLFQQVARGLQHRKIKHPDQYLYTKEIHAERNALAEICYFAAYQRPEWSALICNIALQEQVEVLDAFHHVPSPGSHTISSWERALVEGAFSTGLPQSLLTYAILMAAVSCNHTSKIDIAEFRHSIIPALSSIPAYLEDNLVIRDFLLTSVGQYLAASQHQHPDWYASANLLCGMGFNWVFENHGPAVAIDSDDPHALVFAYHTDQVLSPDGSNRILRRYKSQLEGSSSTSSTSTLNGNSYYTTAMDSSVDLAASTIVQRTLGDAARAMVMAHALHANDWKLLLDFALGTPIDRHVRGVLFEAASRIIAKSSMTMGDAGLLADNALRLLAEFQAVPPNLGVPGLSQQYQQHFMFFLPSDVAKASQDGGGRFDATFGMLFSVLIAEKETGYEATVGFLRLLTVIAQWTVVPALYAEYAVFVLDHVQAKTDRDRDRVYTAALEFLQCILVRYDCVTENTTFGYDELNRHLVVQPTKMSSVIDHSDFKGKSEQELVLPSAAMPQGPSAGFVALISMLCRNRCSLLKRIIDVLLRRPNVDDITPYDKLTLTRALYRDTPPSFSTARIGASRLVTNEDRKSVCEKEKKNLMVSSSEDFGVKVVQSALKILCATLIRETEFRRKTQDSNHALRYVPTMNAGKQINDVTIHISGSLVHLFAEASPWGVLIDKIGFQTIDPIVEAIISSMATAALWGLLDKLPLPQISQVIHTQEDNEPGGTSLAKAVTRRLNGYSSRSLLLEDVSYLRFLMKIMLSDLRNPQNVISSSLFGSSSRVMEALMLLLESDEFLLETGSVDVAVQCLETIYLLTWIGGDVAEVVVSAKRASRLREKDFWNVNLKRLFQQGVDITAHHLHGIAWLLQGFANEIYLVAGAASGHIGLPSDQQLLAPQPPLLRRYVADLMLEDDAFVLEALKVLSMLNSDPPLHPSSLNTARAQLALESSKVEVSGPGGNSGGYMVDTSLLAEALGRDFRDWDQVEHWVDSWNTSVAVECAVTHLSDALSLVVGSAVVGFFPSTGNELTGAGSKHILLVLLVHLSRQENLRAGTARSLAKMVLVIAGTFSETNVDDEFANSALRLLCRAIASTSEQTSSLYANDSYKHGTVAILASSFLLFLRGLSGPAYLLDEGDFTDFCRAFNSLVATGLSNSEASSTIESVYVHVLSFHEAVTTTISDSSSTRFCQILGVRREVSRTLQR